MPTEGRFGGRSSHIFEHQLVRADGYEHRSLPETLSDVEVYLLHRTDPCDTALTVNNGPELRFFYGLQVGKMLS